MRGLTYAEAHYLRRMLDNERVHGAICNPDGGCAEGDTYESLIRGWCGSATLTALKARRLIRLEPCATIPGDWHPFVTDAGKLALRLNEIARAWWRAA